VNKVTEESPMSRSGRSAAHAALALALPVLLVACQGGGAPSSSTAAGGSSAAASAPVSEAPATPSTAESAPAGADATVIVATSPTLGDYLTDAGGRTLYYFLQDSPGVTSCFDACLQTWPAFTVDAGVTPTAGDGITGQLGAIERPDGSTQVTLEQWPLYYFAADAAPGDTNGEGVGNVWFVARPDGSVEGTAASVGRDY
jgi:predicted lipoprotein with Yx(FWY)xxD motif